MHAWLVERWWVWALLSGLELLIVFVLNNESTMPVYANF